MRLLVAEADASLAGFLQTRLQQEHFAVQLASTGDEMSKFGEKSACDLILLDLNLPGVAGPDYLRQLLSPKQYARPEFLLRSPGHPVTRAGIIEEVWRIHGDSITSVLDV